jgi:adenylate cyclase
LETRHEARLEAEPKELTLFFSDIRAFSTTVESLPSQALAEWLGDYLEVMAETVSEHGGTVDKFIGDAVMAFWNAPRPVEDHAYRAVLAAFACQEAIGRLADAEHLYTRIGIHTDTVLVGNFGSPERLNYTALGDGVNLASRLEGVNKLYGTRIIISEATFRRIEGRIDCRRLDRIAVKGKAQATDIYQPLGPSGSLSPQRLEAARAYERALDHYLVGQFAAAHAAFLALLEQSPGDQAANVMAERCAALAGSAPPAEWTGVYELQSK